MICPKCENLNADTREFCFHCGEPLRPYASVEQQPKGGTSQQSTAASQKAAPNRASVLPILSRSVSARTGVERWHQEGRKKGNEILAVFILPTLVFFLAWAWSISSDNTRMQEIAEGVSGAIWIWIILLGAIIFGFYFYSKIHRELDELVTPFLIACDTEYLIIDEEKIYGSTKYGTVTLKYHQIKNVRCVASQLLSFYKNIEGFSYNRLVITDKGDNRFEFISFANARELRTLMESIISEGRHS